MLTLFDFPAEHWIHLCTTNPIESAFATVKSRTHQTKGAGSRKAGLALASKLILAAQEQLGPGNVVIYVSLVTFEGEVGYAIYQHSFEEYRWYVDVPPIPDRECLLPGE